MQQDGPRLKKLKEIYKRAIQEFLKEEDQIKAMFNVSLTKDSFYSDTSVNMKQEDVKEIFEEIKQKFSEILKLKLKETGLDVKLNKLDKDIREGRQSYADVRNVENIREIFQSYIADRKENLFKLIEECDHKVDSELEELRALIEQGESEIVKLREENKEKEALYERLIRDMEGVCLE